MKIIDFKDARCRHCYKCVRNCNVKAISVRNQQAHIMEHHCIHCGHCLEVCPQNAKTFASDMDRVKSYVRRKERLIISIAPSYLGLLNFWRPGQVAGALKKLGFEGVRETSEGAAYVTREYSRLISEGKMDNIITTCCPSINDLIEKYYPSLTSQMAPVISPMAAHGRLIKKLYGSDVKVVFLGPCVAKKEEALCDERVAGSIDAILTFEELVRWLEEEKIEVCECDELPVDNPSPRMNRHYPVSGGIIKSVLDELDDPGRYQRIYVDGLEACMELLESIQNEEIHGCFLELNVCEGGCIKGPASGHWNQSFVKTKLRVEKKIGQVLDLDTPFRNGEQKDNQKMHKKFEYREDIPMEKIFTDRHIQDMLPDKDELLALLGSMGKYAVADELNCGACGYPTCRDKAIAVYQGKAEVDMCLPYAVSKAESMANVVLDTTPDLIFIVDRELRIQECNKAVQKTFGISHEDAIQSYIFEFVDDDRAERVLNTKENIQNKKTKIESLGLKLSQSVVYIEERDCVLVIYKDVTKEEQAKEQHFKLKMETVDMAQEVIDKQMMVAQEIAGLLGETTAETKVTLSKLRDAILSEEE